MYTNPTPALGAGAATGGTLAMTGAASPLWIFLAAFAMIAVATAILRIVPRRRHHD